jgi:hypothetical protein
MKKISKLKLKLTDTGTEPEYCSIATGYVLNERGVRVRVFWQGQEFSVLHVVQTGSGAHPVPCTIGTEDSFPGSKVTGA